MSAAPERPESRPTLTLVPGRHKRAKQGHPWIFSNEIAMDSAAKALAPGSLVALRAADGEPLGVATFNPHALIAARLLDRDPRTIIDAGFFAARLRRALTLRERLFREPAYRLIHAEGDGLPGLVIDRYDGVAVCQVNTAGMERLTDIMLAALDDVLAPKAVVLRNDSSSRALEALESAVRVAKGAIEGPVRFTENGVVFLADPIAGQKTGWFFDQRDNRAFVAALAAGRRVLDVYCHTGAFAVQAAKAGARAVLAIDRSEPALALATQAATENGVEARCKFSRAEAFGEMPRLAEAGEKFDVVIADPPAFAKTRKDAEVAARGYRKMTRLAGALVAPGGILFVASCSHPVEMTVFTDQVRRGIADLGRTGRILRSAGAAPDHPVHPFLPETAYLKALTLQVD